MAYFARVLPLHWQFKGATNVSKEKKIQYICKAKPKLTQPEYNAINSHIFFRSKIDIPFLPPVLVSGVFFKQAHRVNIFSQQKFN